MAVLGWSSTNLIQSQFRKTNKQPLSVPNEAIRTALTFLSREELVNVQSTSRRLSNLAVYPFIPVCHRLGSVRFAVNDRCRKEATPSYSLRAVAYFLFFTRRAEKLWPDRFTPFAFYDWRTNKEMGVHSRWDTEKAAFLAAQPRDSLGEILWPLHSLEVRINRLDTSRTLTIPLLKLCTMQIPDYVRVRFLSFLADFPNQLPSVVKEWLGGMCGDLFTGTAMCLTSKEIRPSALLGAELMSMAAFKPSYCEMHGFGFTSAGQLAPSINKIYVRSHTLYSYLGRTDEVFCVSQLVDWLFTAGYSTSSSSAGRVKTLTVPYAPGEIVIELIAAVKEVKFIAITLNQFLELNITEIRYCCYHHSPSKFLHRSK